MNSFSVYNTFLVSLLLSASAAHTIMETIRSTPELSSLNEILDTQELAPIKNMFEIVENQNRPGAAITFLAPTNEVMNQLSEEEKSNMLQTLSDYIIPQNIACKSPEVGSYSVNPNFLRTLNIKGIDVGAAELEKRPRTFEYLVEGKEFNPALLTSEKQIPLRLLSKCESPNKVLMVSEAIPKAKVFNKVLSETPEVSEFKDLLQSHQIIQEVEELPQVVVYAPNNEQIKSFRQVLAGMYPSQARELIKSKCFVPFASNPQTASEWEEYQKSKGVNVNINKQWKQLEQNIECAPIKSLNEESKNYCASKYYNTPQEPRPNFKYLNYGKSNINYVSANRYPEGYSISAQIKENYPQYESKKLFENGLLMTMTPESFENMMNSIKNFQTWNQEKY